MPGFEPRSSQYEADSIPMCYRASVTVYCMLNKSIRLGRYSIWGRPRVQHMVNPTLKNPFVSLGLLTGPYCVPNSPGAKKNRRAPPLLTCERVQSTHLTLKSSFRHFMHLFPSNKEKLSENTCKGVYQCSGATPKRCLAPKCQSAPGKI